MKRIFFALAILVLLALPVARAAQPGAAATSASDLGSYPGGTAGTADVISGHVYSNDLNATQGTYKWVGLFGNVTGTIVLEDTNGKQFFNWTGAKGLLVYASTATVDWASIEDANAGNVTAAYPFLASGTDDYANTFTGAAESIGSNIYTTVTSDYAAPFPVDSGFKVYSLKDANNAIVWAGKVLDPAATTYNGGSAEFEMLIPENGTNNDNTATTYNFWVELN